MTKPLVHGLYAITQVIDNNEELLFEQISAVLRGGTKFVQYRDKINDTKTRLRIGHRLLMLCKELEASLIINDDIALCLKLNADGVHLGKDDTGLKTARGQLGEDKIIGVSCYNQLQLAINAEQNGADYIAFGSFYSSSTKPNAKPAHIELLSEAKTQLTLPTVAIGGITIDNGRALVDAGADALAVVKGLFAANDVEATAQRFSNYFL